MGNYQILAQIVALVECFFECMLSFIVHSSDVVRKCLNLMCDNYLYRRNISHRLNSTMTSLWQQLLCNKKPQLHQQTVSTEANIGTRQDVKVSSH